MTRTTSRTVSTLAATLLSLATFGPARPASTRPDRPSPKQSVQRSLTQLPSVFEENAGQFGAGARFVSRGAGHTLALGAGALTLALPKGGGKEGDGDASPRAAHGENARGRRAPEPSYRLVRMRFVGADPRALVEGEGALDGRVNYFVGRDPSKWHTRLRTYAAVRYRKLYPGVDLLFHGGEDGGKLEYDFVLAPGADPRDVRLSFDGANGLSLGEGGELLIQTEAGTIAQSAPFVYQQFGGERRAVLGGYVLRGRREVGFRVGAYDRTRPLVIDPVLVYSTYFPNAYTLAVDAPGAVYVTGTAYSFYGDYPVTPGAFQTTRRGAGDAFVAKLNPSGTGFEYLTYLGGSDTSPSATSEDGRGIAIDAAGNAYVTGRTDSPDFPVVNAFQTANAGLSDAFVAKLNATGTGLVYSTYLGGRFAEAGAGIAVDAAGAAYVVGGTNSPDFPSKNAVQPQKKGSDDFFVTKVAPDGRSLEYSTYLGGTMFELGNLARVAVDATGAAYVGGSTNSPDYPTTPGAFQETPKRDDGLLNTKAVVTKIAPGGSALVYSTYIGGSKAEYAYDIALDALGQAHLVGQTTSADFPTQSALIDTARDPYTDGFVTKLNAAGTGLIYSSYLSGTPRRPCGTTSVVGFPPSCSGEFAFGVATDALGDAYVTGNTISGDFPPAADALQPNLKGYSDAYVLKLSPAGQALWATYLGGNSFDTGLAVGIDAAGAVYVLGSAPSDDFPTVNPFHDGRVQDFDNPFNHFLAKFTQTAPAQTGRLHFTSASYTVGESARTVQVGVERAGDLSQAVTVDYSTSDGTASERSDYTTARGTLRFAPGEAAKSFNVSLTDDRRVEGDEWLALTLHNLRGPAVLDAPASAQLDIEDDDEHPGASNPIDETEFYVRQHYLDFLGREPDAAGLRFWSGEIESCGANQQCREVKRINVSAAFFLSIEFQETGFLVECVHRLAFEGRVPYRSFVKEARALGEGVVVGQGNWRSQLDSNRRAWAEEFTARAAFSEEFPESLTAAQYVERLNARATGALSPVEFAALVAGLETGAETRGSALLKVADDEDFRRREFAPAFVLMQYLGYLRRDPDEAGYRFWLDKLDAFGGDYIRAEMVRAFITSDEYRGRFQEPQKEVALSTPFTLGRGEAAVVQPDKLRLTLLDVGFDSRCPGGSQCSTPGSVSILIEAARPDGEAARLLLDIPGGAPRPFPANTPVSALGYTFRLLQLDPEPPSTTQPSAALLQVDRN